MNSKKKVSAFEYAIATSVDPKAAEYLCQESEAERNVDRKENLINVAKKLKIKNGGNDGKDT